ncbi:hypothetical protein WME76_33075 [Sorangium sp. So ce119]|uniref:hypothetical protein n=1 Tax=Sorangium sp. So ce119 TaxID=3133279 RepID=UPI003F61F5AB
MRGRRGAAAGATARGRTARRPLLGPARGRAAGLRAGSSARWIALLALLAQLSGLAHALLVRHARCEHGELVHVGALVDAGHGAARAALPAAAAAPPQAEGGAPGPGDRVAAQDALPHLDDDHCDAFALRGQLGAPVHRVGEATLLEVLRLAALRPSPEVRPIPLLILAPKSSPPAA